MRKVWYKKLDGKWALAVLVLSSLLLTACRKEANEQNNGQAAPEFSVDILNKYTPIKNQGRGHLCWAYAMLSAIETEHLMKGDSVNLSVAFVLRSLMEDIYPKYILTAGKANISDRATAQTLINLIQTYGIRPFDSYRGLPSHSFPDESNVISSDVLLRKTILIAQKALNAKAGLNEFKPQFEQMLDESLGKPAEKVYMLGCEYSPQEFARSVCRPDEYVALTSFSHHPFFSSFPLEVPDNWEQNKFLNIPIDSLVSLLDSALINNHGVCWEGDISEPGFSFKKGIALLKKPIPTGSDIQLIRQQLFERRRTTDDHCMAVVGIAHDQEGRKFYIMKNSWGTDNPYGGLIYMEDNYLKLKTIALFLPKDVIKRNGNP